MRTDKSMTAADILEFAKRLRAAFPSSEDIGKSLDRLARKMSGDYRDEFKVELLNLMVTYNVNIAVKDNELVIERGFNSEIEIKIKDRE